MARRDGLIRRYQHRLSQVPATRGHMVAAVAGPVRMPLPCPPCPALCLPLPSLLPVCGASSVPLWWHVVGASGCDGARGSPYRTFIRHIPPSRSCTPTRPPSLTPPCAQELLRLNVFKGASNLIGAKDFIGRCKVAINEMADVSAWRGVVVPELSRAELEEEAGRDGLVLSPTLVSWVESERMEPGDGRKHHALEPYSQILHCTAPLATERRAARGQVGAAGHGRVCKRRRMREC